MTLFFGSFIAFILTALALGISVLVSGRPLQAGCRNAAHRQGCDAKAHCRVACGFKS